MKKILVIILIFTILICNGCKKIKQDENPDALKGTITISGAWALYPMAVRWAEEFRKIHPAIRIDISAGGAGKGMADVLSDVVDIGNVSREITQAEIEKGAWWVSVVKDAVVPVINDRNPHAVDILSNGITQNEFKDIWIEEKIKTWDMLTGKPDKDNITIYTRSDACGAAQTWALYLGGNQEDLTGIGVYGDPGLAEAVRKDILGIGYNNINYAYDSKSGNPVQGLRIIPLDLNSNNTIDPSEDFYSTRDEVIRAISNDIYPSPPARLLHFVCHGQPQRVIVKKFIQWVLTVGQDYVTETGYIPVEKGEIEKGLQSLK